jgi:hypothetical protein
MSADFSRVRMNPLLNYAGVELKQGAVLLDADANELVGILDRRLRALASDVLGRATVGANTPDAFRITLGSTPTGAATLLIGPGRLYVDGLLAENHGRELPAERTFDPLLGEPCFSQPVAYDDQPYLPRRDKLPAGGRHIVYLDAWNRELTHLEQPGLVEPAVGVETSSRLQTIWQVKVLPGEIPGDVTCGTPDNDIRAWAEHIAPSEGRLTTGTFEVADVRDPCELPPTGGYRGLENQLYRLEIHDGGPAGTATFKWSRENASPGSRIVSFVSASELELESLGRDEVLGLRDNDWVEILDDARELAGLPGEMRRISIVPNKLRHIALHAALPVDLAPASFPDGNFAREHNLRLRFWNQRDLVSRTGTNGSTVPQVDLNATPLRGVITVPVGNQTLLLENGVTVDFRGTGARGFRTGDYWVFAARTADASVEKLDQAPPRGIHHHYTRLAIWDAGANAAPTDCRHPWPPAGGDDCGCTQCVSVEDHNQGRFTIEDAVQRVQRTGGTICLQPGLYQLEGPITVKGARSVRIKGQGAATVLRAAIGAFRLEDSMGLSIENMAMIITSDKMPGISIRSCIGVALRELVLLSADPQSRTSAIALSGMVAGFTLRDSLVVGPVGLRALDRAAPEGAQVLISAAMRIEDNVFWCSRQAIDFTGLAGHLLGTHISDNEFLGARATAITLAGAALPGAAVRVTGNTLNVSGPGIRCAVDGAWISDNKLHCASPGNAQEKVIAGIILDRAVDANGSDQCQVLANQISGFTDAGVLIDAPVRDLICKLNIIEKCGNGIVMTNGSPAGQVSIENNHLRDIGSERANSALGPTIDGIRVTRAASANIAGNTLRGIGTQAVRGVDRVAGIAQLAVRGIRVTGNDITEVGPPTAVPIPVLGGIVVLAPYEASEIAGNHISRDAASAAEDTMSWSAVYVDEPGPTRPSLHVGDFTVVHLATARHLVLAGTHAFATEATLDFSDAAAPVPRRSSVSMRGNTVRARGSRPAVAIEATANVQFSDNRCELTGRGSAAVQISAPAAVVSANVVVGFEDAIRINADIKHVTVLGNATRGRIVIGQNTTLAGTPWEALNVRL